MLASVSHAHAFESFSHSLLAFNGPQTTICQRKLNVFEDREVADQIEALKDEADFAISNARAFGKREVGDRLASQPVTSVRRRVQ